MEKGGTRGPAKKGEQRGKRQTREKGGVEGFRRFFFLFGGGFGFRFRFFFFFGGGGVRVEFGFRLFFWEGGGLQELSIYPG